MTTPLRLDVVTLGVPDVRAALAFYDATLSPRVTDHDTFVDLDLHGHGHVGLVGDASLAAEVGAALPTAASRDGFRGLVLSYVLDQPAEVRAVEDAATAGGARVLKPARKGFFGGFTGYWQAPDGVVWEPAAGRRKDSAPPASPARPTEVGLILGVADPVAARDFYVALGMSADRDYGRKFVGLAPGEGAARLSLIPRDSLAKDSGAGEPVDGFAGVVLHHRADSREEVDALLAAAEGAGGRIVVPAAEASWGGYAGHVADLDGFVWKMGTAT